MNNRKGRVKFKSFLILLKGGFVSVVVMVILVEKINPDKDIVMQWHTQVGNITTNLKVKIDFTLPALSATNVVTWKCHVDDSTKGIYGMILGRDILTEL